MNDNYLFYDFSKNADKDTIIKNLSKILNIGEDVLKDKLTPKEVRYIKFLSKLNLQTKDKIDARIESEKNAISKGLLSENDSIYKFLILEPHPTRFYPEKNLASQVL